MKALLPFALLIPLVVHAATKVDKVTPYYNVTQVPTPTTVDPEIGGLDAFPDGRIAVAFHHGEIGIYTPSSHNWEIFAEGLHEPLGVLVDHDGSLLVMQRPELTRLKSSTGKGPADTYETVWDGFGQTGNYHEFAFGPVRGPDGKLYVALNLASNGDSIRREIRGEWCPIGVPREDFYTAYGKKKKEVGRMYSRVPYRGCVMQIDPETHQGSLFATGFRSPDGLTFDTQGHLIVDDNQGDWRGASEVFFVKQDGFYGHPASLVWRKDWSGENPLRVPIAKLNELRTPAAIWFPYGTMANSPTQMVTIPKTAAWGPYGGQLLVGEMNFPRIIRLLPEQIDGVWQGACVNFIEGEAVQRGGHRFVFSGDTLWMGRIHLSWAGSTGLASIVPTGKTPFDPLDMHITPHGFRFDFTAPLAESATNPALWTGSSFYYLYREPYGSPPTGKTDAVPLKVTLSNGNKTAEIELPPLKKDYMYDFDLSQLTSASGEPIVNSHIAYTVRRVPKE